MSPSSAESSAGLLKGGRAGGRCLLLLPSLFLGGRRGGRGGSLADGGWEEDDSEDVDENCDVQSSSSSSSSVVSASCSYSGVLLTARMPLEAVKVRLDGVCGGVHSNRSSASLQRMCFLIVPPASLAALGAGPTPLPLSSDEERFVLVLFLKVA